MKKHFGKILIAAAVLCVIAVAFFSGDPKQKIVREAYIYGYPLVTMDLTRRQETNVRVPDDAHAPMGQMIKLRAYPAVDATQHVNGRHPSKIIYHFQVGDQMMEGVIISFDTTATRRCSGQPVWVLYNESDPTENAIYPPLS